MTAGCVSTCLKCQHLRELGYVGSAYVSKINRKEDKVSKRGRMKMWLTNALFVSWFLSGKCPPQGHVFAHLVWDSGTALWVCGIFGIRSLTDRGRPLEDSLESNIHLWFLFLPPDGYNVTRHLLLLPPCLLPHHDGWTWWDRIKISSLFKKRFILLKFYM